MPQKSKSPSGGLGLARPPLERMLRIHQALQAGGYPKATELALDLEVSRKTIQRDFDFMRDRLNLPLAYHREKGGYGYTEEVAAFPTLEITEGELFTLLVAEKALQQYRGTSFEQPLVSAFRKIAAGLPERISFHWADWDQTISFRTSAEPVLDLGVFKTLAGAVRDQERVVLTYRKPGRRDAEERVVDPYHLANINGEWFLFGHCHLRNDLRTFVPARIQTVRLTGERFERPKHFSLERRLRDSFGVHSGTGQHLIRIRFSELVADYIREKKWHPSQQLEELADGGVELSLRLSSLVEVQRWILGWGGEALVLEPVELAEAVAAAGQAIWERQTRPIGRKNDAFSG